MTTMFADSQCPPDVVAAAGDWRPGIALFAVHAALHKDITYRLGDGSEVHSTSGGLGGPEGTVRQVEGCRFGEPEFDDPWMLLVSSTVADRDRAPGGTFKILTAAPADLAGGRRWEDLGPRYGQHLLSLAARHVQGLHSHNIAAMLNAGFDLRAADRGCFVVRTVSDVLPDYIATVLAALPRWLEKESAARPFLRAWDRDSPASNEFPFILSGLRFQSCYWCAVRDRRVAIPVRTVLPLVSA